jgi:ABC-type glycerol-3-phosphate transport system permease component
MTINFEQLLLSGIIAGITGGITVIFTSMAGYIVMRYFPKLWARVESGIKNWTMKAENKE